MFFCRFFLLTALVYNTICWSSNAGYGNPEGSSKEEKRPGIIKIFDFISFMACTIVGGCGKKNHRESFDRTPGNQHGHAIDSEGLFKGDKGPGIQKITDFINFMYCTMAGGCPSHGFGRDINVKGESNLLVIGDSYNKSGTNTGWDVITGGSNQIIIGPNESLSTLEFNITGDGNEVTFGCVCIQRFHSNLHGQEGQGQSVVQSKPSSRALGSLLSAKE